MQLAKRPVKELSVKEFIEAYNQMCARWTSATKNPPSINEVVDMAVKSGQIKLDKGLEIIKEYGK